MELFLSKKLYSKKSNIEGAGYGIYTDSDIEKGEIIEVSKFIEVDLELFDKVGDNIKSVLYSFPKDNPKINAIVLGYGSLYNSSLDNLTNNVDWITDEVNNTFIYSATMDIKKDSELYIYYNNYEFNMYKDWTDEDFCNHFNKQNNIITK